MADIETRFASVELRALPEGRRLQGIAMPYGAVSEAYRERFLLGALTPAPRGLVHVRHDRSKPIAGWPGSVELRDTAAGLEAVTEVDDTDVGNAFMAEARAGRFGYSVEFNRAESSMTGGIREISKAVLIGLGVTPFPSYPGTGVELRGERLAAVLNAEIGEGGDRQRTVARLARAAGIDESTVGQILRGEIMQPPIERLRSFALVLGIPLASLIRAARADGGRDGRYSGAAARAAMA